MNERIRELELEAIAYADSKVPANDRYNDIYHSIVRGKFTELIVRECAAVAGKFVHDNKYNEEGISEFWLKEEIKEHFGVEE